MPDFLKHLATGDAGHRSARRENAISDVIRANQRSRDRIGGALNGYSPEGLIYVKNSSGGDRLRFDVLGIQDLLIGPQQNVIEFTNRPSIVGRTPIAAQDTGYFVVCYERIAAGAIGRAFIFGVCPVQVNMVAAHDHFADVSDGDCTQLKSGSSGAAQILLAQNPSGTGTMWALVRLGAGSIAGLIPVTLTNGSGSQGDNTTPAAAARLYDAHDANTGTSVGTGLQCWQARQKGHITDGTKAFVMTISGTKYILLPDEVLDATVCSGSGGSPGSPAWMGL